MLPANNIAVTLGWLAASRKVANAEEVIIRSLKSQVKDLPMTGILDCWYDMTNRKAKLNAGDWCGGDEIDAWKASLVSHDAVDGPDDIEVMDEAGGPGSGDWVKIASVGGVDIRDSPINGRGLFATRAAEPGDVLVAKYMEKQNTDDPRTRWEQSDYCRYTNHADNPNAFVRKIGEKTELVADETIQPNEEITVNYRDASKAVGKAFFYTYRGKPYGNDPKSSEFLQKTASSRPQTLYGLPTIQKQAQTAEEMVAEIAYGVQEKLAVAPPVSAPAIKLPPVSQVRTGYSKAQLNGIPTTLPAATAAAQSPATAPAHAVTGGGPRQRVPYTPRPTQPANIKNVPSLGTLSARSPAELFKPNPQAAPVPATLQRPVRVTQDLRAQRWDPIKPTYESLYEQLAAQKYYTNSPGGLDSVIARAAVAAERDPIPGVKSYVRDIGTPVKVNRDININPHESALDFTWDGDKFVNIPAYENRAGSDAGPPKVTTTGASDLARDNTAIQSILEHELTHGAQVNAGSTLGRLAVPPSEFSDKLPPGDGEYAARWIEIDPRLAEIKRHYSRQHPGTDVTNPDEAAKAWNWFINEGYKTHPTPSLYEHDIPMWQQMTKDPEAFKSLLMRRMPQVVQQQQSLGLKQAQTTDDILSRILNARKNTATDVSEGNAAAGNYRKGRFNYHGLRISIENPKGSTRSGTGADGKKWSTKMKYDYGYIRGTMGADGDPVDVFIGSDPKSELVFIVNQNTKGGKFDEHKVVLGALDAKQAKQTYLANYEAGWTGCGSVVGLTMQQFKQWLKDGVTDKPVSDITKLSAIISEAYYAIAG